MKGKTKYNPAIHHRRSIRLKGYDYGQAGLYFITICSEGMKHRFGKITVGAPLAGAQNNNGAQMALNEYGQIAYNEWAKLAERFSNFELDVFQIMPNHFHGIILLNELPVGAGFTPAPTPVTAPAPNEMNNQFEIFKNDLDSRATARVAPTKTKTTVTATTTATTTATMSDIVGAYKSLVANGCLDIYKAKNETMGKLWQRNYYEHIIRDEQSYQRISHYILNNPAKWVQDKFYTARI